MVQATDTTSVSITGMTPHLVCSDAAAAIDFYKQAFGAVEQMRLVGESGRVVHAAVEIGGFPVMLGTEQVDCAVRGPTSLGGTPVTIHLSVGDVDATFAHVLACGATEVMAVADMFWGDRYGIVEDPFGHRWSLATPQRKLTVEEIRAAMAEQMPNLGNA